MTYDNNDGTIYSALDGTKPTCVSVYTEGATCVKHYVTCCGDKATCMGYYTAPYGTDENDNPVYQVPGTGEQVSSPPTAQADAYCERCIDTNTGNPCT